MENQVADLGHNNEVLVAIASSKGSLVLGRLLLPRAPGTELDEVQVCLFGTIFANKCEIGCAIVQDALLFTNLNVNECASMHHVHLSIGLLLFVRKSELACVM